MSGSGKQTEKGDLEKGGVKLMWAKPALLSIGLDGSRLDGGVVARPACPNGMSSYIGV